MCGIVINIKDNNGSKQKLLDSLPTQKDLSEINNKKSKIIDNLIEIINSDDSINEVIFEVPLPTRC